MDGFGQIGPEKGDYAADVRRIAELLEDEATVFTALADRGTRIELVLVKYDSVFPVGTATPNGVTAGDGYLFVGVREHGAYWFILGSFHDPAYVAERLGVGVGDGEIVAEFLTRLHAAMEVV